MEDMSNFWLVVSLAFLFGALCGAFIYHVTSGVTSRNDKLADDLQQLQQEQKEYQQRVNEHFATTAHLINKLTDNYRDIHEHLANSADELCKDDEARNRLSDSLLGSNALLSAKTSKRRNERTPPLEQPKDYAPKSSPDEQGALAAEEYNLTTEPTPELPDPEKK